ncbi:acetyltransferase, ribosomal protein N-acetylase [Frankia torreyi]|uniref:Acetyltransferase, ribosomal protein N-acetylase n=1 Tax=Frankia torreyi TaxID=1856 RepID=A0A0D8BHX1_9ACTN|nr:MULTISPECIES: GNAT family N-acetyltransferase [Frankia]KJE23711.1 acetyltransferase, ribosomal protein N-acetylase [Frankia torreyi]
MTTIPTLTTDRLILRPIARADLDAYAEIWSDEEFTRHIGGPSDRHGTWHNLAGNIGCWTLEGVGPWSVVERATGTLIGRAGLWNEPGWPGIEAVWFIGRPWWGHGFGTEAATAAIGWAFDEYPDLPEVVSVIRATNAASIRLAERLGMHLTRTERLHGAEKGIYAIARSEWVSRAPTIEA